MGEGNPFHWTIVVMNLLTSNHFYPSIPVVCKLNEKSKRIAGYYVAYIEDIRMKFIFCRELLEVWEEIIVYSAVAGKSGCGTK